MANNIDKKEPVTNCEQSKIDIIKCDNHELAGNIEPLIKVIRGQQVMLDRDLATLYGVETKRLNEQVKRNIKRFPEDFMFQLTKDECLRSQIATLNEGRGQHLKYMPYVFTENGVAMLSSVLIAYHQVGIFAHDVYLLNLLLVEFIEHPIVFLLVAQARLLDAANRHRIVEYQESSLQLHGSYLGEIEQGFLHVLQLQGKEVGEERLLAGFQIVQKFDDRKL